MMGFDEWFGKTVIYTDNDLLKPLTRQAYKSGAASRQAEIDELKAKLAMYEREGYKLVPVEACGDVLIVNNLSIHINQTGSGRVFCDITFDGNLISQRKSIEDAFIFCKEYSYDAN